MSWLYSVYSKEKSSKEILEILISVQNLVRDVVGYINTKTLELNASIFSIYDNAKQYEIGKDDKWNWSPSQYLWIQCSGRLGIDVELESVKHCDLEFLRSDMISRGVDDRRIDRALYIVENGYCYSIRASFNNDLVLYVALLSLASLLAQSTQGFIYTLDADGLSSRVPLWGEELEVLLRSNGGAKGTF
ncbi:MAG TPA: hypothetical protein DCM28_09825 [Phycisphaerales bacterium]|nr:hypothetical protein [Phycisphaerales bacterium]HCD32604.1 hypothetical protein [Phycisphaerales bacterium]|tara:strand:- start:1569 stop:2135 length:567 start_codon:yes stop_codon:yes gene_type:complete